MEICQIGKYTADDACEAAPACEGDAVQCAQALEVWKLKCAMTKEPEDAAYTRGKSIAAGEGDSFEGNPLDSANAQDVDIGAVISQAAGERTLSGTCIAPQTLTLLGHSYTLDTTQLCNFAQIVGYLMVACASIIAVRMVTSGA